ncbi:MAG: fatty acid desaturase [Myxococcales bacterium]|nr:fatty acid desaturase [Myxococcales bacterium]
MSAIVASLSVLPYTQFRKSRHFYLYYDGCYMLAFLALIAMAHTGVLRPMTVAWDLSLLWWLPLAIQAQILCSVWIHNATHNNFPRAINRIVGELCGVAVGTRFASWEIIHQRHHKYSDDPVLDPHPVMPGFTGYWQFAARSVVSVEQQLQAMHYEMYGGKTPENVRYQRNRAFLSFGTMLVLAYAWAVVLGLPAFFMLYLPATILGTLHLMHFNWSTHNPWSPNGDHLPVNLDHGFYKIGNVIWHGIYFHGNHHQNASMFNPSRLDAEKSLPIIVPGDLTDDYPRKKTKVNRALLDAA